MTYNPNIPQSNDLISQSQGQFLTNFSQLNTIFDVDHVTYDNATVANRGLHRKVTFPAVITDPNQTAPISSLYIKTVSGSSQLFFQNGNGAANVIPITASVFQTYTPTVSAGTYVFSGVSANGYYAIIGGITFFTIQISFTNAVGSPAANPQVTLPSTSVSTGGQGNLEVARNSVITANAVGTITAANNYITFPHYTQPTNQGAQTYFINGFYI